MDSKSGRSWRACGYSNIALRDAGASTAAGRAWRLGATRCQTRDV